MRSLVLAVVLAALAPLASADLVTAYGTGYDMYGAQPQYAADLSWTIGTMGGAATVSNQHPAWVNVPGAQYINGTGSASDQIIYGLTEYHTTFYLDGYDPSTASIALNFAVDNSAEIFLNGISLTSGQVGGFGSVSNLSYSGPGFLAHGNDLMFLVKNGVGPGNDEVGPTGLAAHLTVNAAPVPEPASMAVLGLGLAALRRRRARK